jgi:hypothetical protein
MESGERSKLTSSWSMPLRSVTPPKFVTHRTRAERLGIKCGGRRSTRDDECDARRIVRSLERGRGVFSAAGMSMSMPTKTSDATRSGRCIAASTANVAPNEKPLTNGQTETVAQAPTSTP